VKKVKAGSAAAAVPGLAAGCRSAPLHLAGWARTRGLSPTGGRLLTVNGDAVAGLAWEAAVPRLKARPVRLTFARAGAGEKESKLPLVHPLFHTKFG
jgi:hypothetical protein